MLVAPHRQVLKAISGYLLLVSLFGPRTFSQQVLGSIKGTVTDQLAGLVVVATLIATDANGKEKTVTTKPDGGYEFRSLVPGNYDLKVVAAGFNVLEEKNVAK